MYMRKKFLYILDNIDILYIYNIEFCLGLNLIFNAYSNTYLFKYYVSLDLDLDFIYIGIVMIN